MSAAVKEKPRVVGQEATARLFGELKVLFSTRPEKLDSHIMAIEVKKKVAQLEKKVSFEEIRILQEVVKNLASELNAVVPARIEPVLGAKPRGGQKAERITAADLDAKGGATAAKRITAADLDAKWEDAAVNQVLKQSEEGKLLVFTTLDSIRAGNEAMGEARRNEVVTLEERIKSGELISSGELQKALSVGRQAISNALTSGRMFAFVGPSGERYYPSFYADGSLDRRVIEKVTKVLGKLPAASKYYFFTSKFTALGRSPLDALRKGRVEDVLAAATSFAEG